MFVGSVAEWLDHLRSLNPGALGSDPAFGILWVQMSLLLIIDRMVSSHDPRLAELRRLAINTS